MWGWLFGTTNNNTNNNMNKNNSSDGNNNITNVDSVNINTIDPVFPNHNFYNGNILLYYACNSDEIYTMVSNIPESKIDDSNWDMIKLAMGINKDRKAIDLCQHTIAIINHLNTIDKTREISESGLEYGQINEYNTSPELRINILKRMKHNQGFEKIRRVLWNIRWEFVLNLPEGWEKIINMKIDDPSLIKISKNIDKLVSYMNYMKLYKILIEKAINFRSKYHVIMGKSDSIINYFDRDFILGLSELYEELINIVLKYQDFYNKLNWFEKKQYDEYAKNISHIKPVFTINFKIDNKSVTN